MPTPLWKKLGQPEPPIVNGMWEHGTVWVPGQVPAEVQNLRWHLRMGWFSYRTWGVKVWKESRGIHYGKTKDAPLT